MERGAVEALVNPSDLQVRISEALRPKRGMSCPRTQLGNGRDTCRAWSSVLLELKGEVWTEGRWGHQSRWELAGSRRLDRQGRGGMRQS